MEKEWQNYILTNSFLDALHKDVAFLPHTLLEVLSPKSRSILPLFWRMVIPWKNSKNCSDRRPFYILKPAELLPGRYVKFHINADLFIDIEDKSQVAGLMEDQPNVLPLLLLLPPLFLVMMALLLLLL